jgi:phosphohistidine phosphatase
MVLVMRHAEAAARSAKNDEGGLTSRGEADARFVLELSRQIGSKVESVFSSPLLRARQTAEIARRVFELKAYSVLQNLEPSGTPYEVFRDISKLDNVSSSVILVSHQPLVSGLVCSLLNWDEDHFFSPPATIFAVEVSDLSDVPRGKLRYMISPPQH